MPYRLTAMPFDGSLLSIGTNGERLVSVALALAILLFWTPSVWRILMGKDRHPDDTHRAGWVPMALAVLVFELRWFWPTMGVLMRARLAFLAHGAMMVALMFAMSMHARRTGSASPRRVFMVHCAMLAVCIGATSILR